MAKIAFVLPVPGGSGGAHSVMQEADALRDLGAEVTVFVNSRNIEAFLDTYDRFAWVGSHVLPFQNARELGALAARAEVVVATTNTSTHTLAEAMRETRASFRTAYYVQDYEPLFYDAQSLDYRLALTSFSVLPQCTYFAKTRWLCDLVRATHDHEVGLVVPSIDHGLYRPRARAARTRPVLCAMVRPSTPRRAPRRTLAVLARAAAGAFGPVEVKAFGAGADDLAAAGLAVPAGVELLGKLKQQEVAALLGDADVFLDLSDYQAFGRTAAEAMACGCIPLAPALGGAGDFIADGVNAFLADTTDPAAVEAALSRMLSMSPAEANGVRYAGLETVAAFTPVRAALSELRVLGLS
ncbi:glycosyltransferase [Xanthobacter sp. V4C-4]|uniref:glycosyltransferase n=1 Tax=Xanthobacter cornucopiae TaxID=3119924 RepID=UPI003728072F